MTVDCQASIRNNFTFVPGSGLTLDSRIRYEEIGELNLKEDVIETFWRLLLPNSEPQELICHPPGTQCLFVNDFLSIIIDMSNNRLDDTAMINISDANFDFDISHTFVTQNQLGTGNTEIKVFTFYYSLSKHVDKMCKVNKCLVQSVYTYTENVCIMTFLYSHLNSTIWITT